MRRTKNEKLQNLRISKRTLSACQSLKLTEPEKSQFDRALLSIVLNLAEGAAKPTRRDRKKFYAIALGSLREVQAILELTGQGTDASALYSQLYALTDTVAACLFCLVQSPGGSH